MIDTFSIAATVANLAARAVALFRPICQHPLTFEDCEAEGLPEDSTEPCVYVQRIHGQSALRVAVWVERDETDKAALAIDLLGFYCQVFFHSRQRALQAAA